MAILDRMISGSIGWIPKPIVRKVAARYVAGETLDQALFAAERLNAEGCSVTFDLLGEFITRLGEADSTRDEYLAILDRIIAGRIDGNISIKLTAFGLLLDEASAYERVRAVVAHAASRATFVRIDMEDSACTTRTLGFYRRLRDEGFKNVGVVLQAYLRRTLDDIRELRPLAPGFRLCKGIYVEPEEIAFKDADEIRVNYESALGAMFDGGSYVGIATHDERLVAMAERMIKARQLSTDRYEFQMLLGVTDDLRRRIVASGHRLRVYVPFGRDWYGYCTRRLKENPKIGRYVLLAMLGRRG